MTDDEIAKMREALKTAYKVIEVVYASDEIERHTLRRLAQILEYIRTTVPGIEK